MGNSEHVIASPESKGARRAIVDSGARPPVGAPDPEVSDRPKRRRFTAEYKLRIVREAEACKGDGDVGALLRREGLCSSQLATWRRQRDEVAQAGLKARRRGPKGVDPRVKELERENSRLKRRLERVELMLSIQKKASEMLGIPLSPPDSDESDW
jgi:transposase-like protein